MGNHVWRGYGKSRVEGVREITCEGDTGNHLWRGYGKSLVEGIWEITRGGDTGNNVWSNFCFRFKDNIYMNNY